MIQNTVYLSWVVGHEEGVVDGRKNLSDEFGFSEGYIQVLRILMKAGNHILIVLI